MDEEFDSTVYLRKLLHRLASCFLVLARDAFLLVVHSSQVTNKPKHKEFDGRHEDVDSHSADDAFADVKEPVGVDVIVDALNVDTIARV